MALGLFRKLFSGLSRTRESLTAALGSLAAAPVVDAATLDQLEASLLAADLGPELCAQILAAVRERARGGSFDATALRDVVRATL
ncbi:MAG TPA: signal recognition particle receptor subunit alpha, partial [Candidatus Polarisedimenticolaceae bacterium]|nr:signal recognition particle receptor subunit alpha [Candidatus Polarisedimenticolaceae bacterium]